MIAGSSLLTNLRPSGLSSANLEEIAESAGPSPFIIPPPAKRLVYTALHQAVLDARLQQVRLLVQKCSSNVDSRDLFGRTALMLCSLLDDEVVSLRMAKVLLNAGAFTGIKDHLGRTALAYACLRDREHLLRLILKSELPDVGEPDNDGNTALHHAAQHASPGLVVALLDSHAEYGTTIDPRNSLGYTPLILAAKFRRFHAAALIYSRSPGSANLRENQCFMNALEWFRRSDRLEIGSRSRTFLKHSHPRQILRQQQARAVNQMRPTFLTERSNTGFTNFYKEITCPALRESRTTHDFHGTDGLPHIPATATKLIDMPSSGRFGTTGNEDVREKEAIKREPSGVVAPTVMRLNTCRTDADDEEEEPPPNFLEMNEREVRLWLFDRLENTDRNRINESDGFRSAPPITSINRLMPTTRRTTSGANLRISLSRPVTRELRKIAPPSNMTTTQSIRYLFRIYCDAVNAPPSAFSEAGRLTADGEQPLTTLTLPDTDNAPIPSAGKRVSVIGRSTLSAATGAKGKSGHK